MSLQMLSAITFLFTDGHGGRRSVRSIARSIDRIDRFDRFGNFFVRSKFFQKIDRAETIDSVQKSFKSEPSSRFFGRLKIFVIFGSVGSVLRSVRSIWRPRVVADRPGQEAKG